MTQCATYTGDLLLSMNTDGDWDLNYVNGQPCMTDGFDTAVMLSVFAEPDFWQNDLTVDPSEKYTSEFPEIVNNGRVDDPTINSGIAGIKKALEWMIDVAAAESIEVTGGFLNVFGLYWKVEIVKPDAVSRYDINWEKGVIEMLGIPVFEGPLTPAILNFELVTSTGNNIVTSDGNQIIVEAQE